MWHMSLYDWLQEYHGFRYAQINIWYIVCFPAYDLSDDESTDHGFEAQLCPW